MKHFVFSIVMLIAIMFSVSCTTFNKEEAPPTPMPVIVLSGPGDAAGPNPPSQVVQYLKMEYGLIIDNWSDPEEATFYLFLRDEKRVVATQDAEVFIDALKSLPDGAKIDMIGKCTVGFYHKYGKNIDEEYAAIQKVMKDKQFELFDTHEHPDPRHLFFCYCGYRKVEILDTQGVRRILQSE